ncbi:MAG: sodium:solute symporter family protein [Bacilli bacterium]
MTAFVFAVIILLSLYFAFRSRRGHDVSNIEEYLVAGRSFSGLLLFFLAVGEIYSIGTLIGLPGGIYAKGVTYGYWFLGYILLAYPVGYFIGPLIWRAGKRYAAMTVPDVFKGHYSHRALELIVTISALIFLIPWGQLQFAGLEVALSALGFHLSPTVAVFLAGCIAFLYIAVSGVRAPAIVSILKDTFMVLAIVIAGVAVMLAVHGVPKVFIQAAAHGVSTTIAKPQDIVFTLTTILFQALGFYVTPLTAPFLFTARSERTVKRTQRIMPLYMLMYPFLIVASYYAFLIAPHLEQANTAFIVTSVSLLPPWLLGVVAAGAALSGILVLATISLAIGGMVSRNLVSNIPQTSQRKWTQIVIVVYLLVSMALTLGAPTLMLTLINTAYYGFTQLFPGFIAVFFSRKVTPTGVAAGLLTGEVAVLVLYLSQANFYGVNPGLVALALNFIVMYAVSAIFAAKVPLRAPVAHGQR